MVKKCAAALAALWLPAMLTLADLSIPETGLKRPDDPLNESLVGFVVHGDPEEVWQVRGRLAALADGLAGLRGDGLAPGRYRHPWVRDLADRVVEGKPLTRAEAFAVTRLYLQALHDLATGVLDPASQGVWYAEGADKWSFQQKLADAAAVGVNDIAAVFERARPDLPLYRNLRHAYRRMAAAPVDAWPRMPAGPLLKEGDESERVVSLRRRLQAQGYLAQDEQQDSATDLFDSDLADALRDFQVDHGLVTDAVLGPRTLSALNTGPRARLDQIRINLERFRWLARDREPEMVLVDIAGARVSYYRHGQRLWQAKAQMGRSYRPTPALKSPITYVTFNPPWIVPPGIFRRDKLPAIRADIGFLEKNNMRVFDRQTGEPLSPLAVDWQRPENIQLRQDPGPGSALGLVALRFPNPFSVYLHDTPEQAQFDSAERFFSSGCVRVEEALILTRYLFGESTHDLMRRVATYRARGQTRHQLLPKPVPLVMAYWTAEADQRGKVTYRPDIYHRDGALLAALNRASETPLAALP